MALTIGTRIEEEIVILELEGSPRSAHRWASCAMRLARN